jgi:hypothetical protein
MKKILLFSLICAGCFPSLIKAQAILTAANFNPVIGEVSTTKSCAYTSPGPSGTSQTWNFSALTSTSTSTSTMVVPSSISGYTAFGSTNIAANASTVGFYFTNSTVFQFWGSKPTPTLSIPYSNPENFMQFPFTYGNSFSDSFAGVFTNGSTFARMGSCTVTADGSGTLITPTATYSNVLRVRLQEVYRDSAYSFPFIINYTNDEYLWYTPGTHSALLALSSLSTSVGPPTQFGVYLSNIVTGVNSIASQNDAFSVFPNPASGKLNIHATAAENKDLQIKLYNVDGRQVFSETVLSFSEKDNYSINISAFPAGLYFAEFQTDGLPAELLRFIIAR